MLLGVAFYSIIIGFISSILTDTETIDTLYAKKVADLEAICSKMDIDEASMLKLKSSLEYSTHKTTYQWLDPQLTLFHELPMRLKYEFLQTIYKDLVVECPFFSTHDMSFTIRIVPLLKPLFLKKDEHLWHEGEYSRFRSHY